MKRLFGMCLLTGVLAFTSAHADVSFTGDDVRAQYVASSQLPTGVAYQEFLRLLSSDDGSNNEYEMSLVSDALGIPLVRDGKPDSAAIDRVQSRLTRFRQSHSEMASERDNTAFDVMCSGNPFASSDETFESMNVVDDLNEFSAEKRLRMDMRRLDKSERKSLMHYLEEMKSSISYVKVDSRTQFKKSMKDMSDDERVAHIRHRLATSCGVLESKIASRQNTSTR